MLSQLDIASHSTFQVLRWLQETRNFDLTGKNVIAIGSHDFLEHDGFVYYGANEIYAFECNPYVWPDLVERTNNREKTKAYNVCLWSQNGLRKDFHFFKDKKYGAGSLFGDAKLSQYVTECQELEETIKLETMTLDAFCSSYYENIDLDDIGWVSLDVQGSELEVLKGASELMYAKPEIFYVEVSWDNLYEGAPLINEIDEFFNTHDYERIGLRKDIEAQGDAIYVRK